MKKYFIYVLVSLLLINNVSACISIPGEKAILFTSNIPSFLIPVIAIFVFVLFLLFKLVTSLKFFFKEGSNSFKRDAVIWGILFLFFTIIFGFFLSLELQHQIYSNYNVLQAGGIIEIK